MWQLQTLTAAPRLETSLKSPQLVEEEALDKEEASPILVVELAPGFLQYLSIL